MEIITSSVTGVAERTSGQVNVTGKLLLLKIPPDLCVFDAFIAFLLTS